jgi:hypothetical protein
MFCGIDISPFARHLGSRRRWAQWPAQRPLGGAGEFRHHAG